MNISLIWIMTLGDKWLLLIRKVWVLAMRFLLLYFLALIFIWHLSPESLESYYQISQWVERDFVVRIMWQRFKWNLIRVPILWFLLAWIFLLIEMVNNRGLWAIWKILLRILLLIVTGIISWFLMLKYDKSLISDEKKWIKHCMYFRIIWVVMQLWWFFSTLGSDILTILLIIFQQTGIWIAESLQ